MNIWNSYQLWPLQLVAPFTLQSHLGKTVVTVHDQNYYKCEQWTCDLVAFAKVALKIGTRSVTTCSQLPSSKWHCCAKRVIKQQEDSRSAITVSWMGSYWQLCVCDKSADIAEICIKQKFTLITYIRRLARSL